MKKLNLSVGLFFVLMLGLLHSCSDDADVLGTSGVDTELRRDENPDSRVESDGLFANWESGTYLTFSNGDEIAEVHAELKRLATVSDASLVSEGSTSQYLLDGFEDERRFVSMRRAYAAYENNMLEAGFTPRQIKDVPIIDDALATLISVDGLVQVGDEIQYFSPTIYASAPIRLKNRLKDILLNGEPLSPTDKENGIDVTIRTRSTCNADFTLQINQDSKEVFVEYTGSSIETGDKQIVWSIEGGDDHENEESFSHTYTTSGTKTICVTYTETEIVQDTNFYYISVVRDSIVTGSDGMDSTITIRDDVQMHYIELKKTVTCTDTYCKEFEIGGCNADFNTTTGIDNVINFTDQSTVVAGTITSWYWTFGDGQTSTLRNPTHTYECDKEYEVTLTITSSACPGGQASHSETVDASGILCCDKNAQSSWRIAEHPTDDKKRIEYRYDLGTNWNWLFDTDFKAKIKYYEYRYGGFWPFKSTKWRKTDGLLDVNFDGRLYSKDEDDCSCQIPADLVASPPNKHDDCHTFQDDLDGTAFSSDTYWMKLDSDVFIDYKVDGVLYIRQHCQTTPGFLCE